LEQWLHTVGVARYDTYHRRAERGQPMAVVFERLRAWAGKKPDTQSKSEERPARARCGLFEN
jgi:hypothetical protein